MRAMILAAGLGKRMRPLTNTMPKPMLKVNGKPLIQYHVENLVNAGIKDIVINHSVFGEQIERHLGDGSALSANIIYSAEGDTPLGTAGGIVTVLNFFGNQPFLVVNADIWSDFSFQTLSLLAESTAHIILVDNPPHNPNGDFYLQQNRVLLSEPDPKLTFTQCLTFSGMSIFKPSFFMMHCAEGSTLQALLRHAVLQGEVSASYYSGEWYDIGTPERLQVLRQHYQSK